jgi:hypothetical protein
MKTFDEVFAAIPSEGWLSHAEANLLWHEVQQTEGDILEVGSYCGRSTVLLAYLGRHVHAVDPHDDFNPNMDTHATLLTNLRYFNVEEAVTVYRRRIEDWAPRPVGFAYLDGDHTYEGTLRQIEVALKCNPQIIAIHDVNDSGGGVGVRDAAVKILNQWNKRVERLAVWKLKDGKYGQ